MWILPFFIARLPEKAKKTEFLLRFQRRMKKTNIFRARSGLIWCRKWSGHRRKPWGQRRFYQPTENVYTTLRSPSKRISVKRSVTFFHLSSSKHRIHQQVRIPNILWQCGNCPEWKDASNCYRQRWGRLTLNLCFLTMSSFELIFTASNLDFHLTLTWSIFQSRKYGLIDKFPNFRINNCFCLIPLQSVLKFCLMSFS